MSCVITRMCIRPGLAPECAGVGYKMGNELTQMEVKTAADLQRISQEKLVQKFGERIGTFLYLACRGQVSLACTRGLKECFAFSGSVSKTSK